MCGSGVDVASSLLLISAILMAVGDQPFHLSRCPNFRNRLNLRHFSLIDYVERLFAVDEGYYRIVVFIVTDQPFTSTNRSITSTEAGLWLADGLNTLPASLGEQPLSSVDRCTALIYEFEKSHGESAHLLIPSPMEARQHLLASGLLRELSISGVGHE